MKSISHRGFDIVHNAYDDRLSTSTTRRYRIVLPAVSNRYGAAGGLPFNSRTGSALDTYRVS